MNPPNSNLTDVKTLLVAMAAETAELQRALGAPVTETLASWLAAQYALAAHQKLAGTEPTPGWEILRLLVHDVFLLRRGDHSAARLQLDREELDLQRANTKTQKEKKIANGSIGPMSRKEFKEFFPEPKPGGLSQEQIEHIERELNLLWLISPLFFGEFLRSFVPLLFKSVFSVSAFQRFSFSISAFCFLIF